MCNMLHIAMELFYMYHLINQFSTHSTDSNTAVRDRYAMPCRCRCCRERIAKQQATERHDQEAERGEPEEELVEVVDDEAD